MKLRNADVQGLCVDGGVACKCIMRDAVRVCVFIFFLWAHRASAQEQDYTHMKHVAVLDGVEYASSMNKFEVVRVLWFTGIQVDPSTCFKIYIYIYSCNTYTRTKQGVLLTRDLFRDNFIYLRYIIFGLTTVLLMLLLLLTQAMFQPENSRSQKDLCAKHYKKMINAYIWCGLYRVAANLAIHFGFCLSLRIFKLGFESSFPVSLYNIQFKCIGDLY